MTEFKKNINQLILYLAPVLAIIASIYFSVNNIYHLINYSETLGLPSESFGSPVPYLEIIAKTIFWLSVLITGIIILKKEIRFFSFARIVIIVSFIISLTQLIHKSFYYLSYSKISSRNGEPHKLSVSEQFEIIYIKPLFLLILTFTIGYLAYLVKNEKFDNLKRKASL